MKWFFEGFALGILVVGPTLLFWLHVTGIYTSSWIK